MKIKRIPLSLFVSIFAIIFMACGSDTYYSSRYVDLDDEFGKTTPIIDTSTNKIFNETIAFEGNFNLVSVLEPVKLEISSLDSNYEKIQTISARIERNRLEFKYKAKELNFQNSIARIDFTCRFRDSKDTTEMDFTIFANMNERGFQNIDFYRTFESEYLNKLLQKKESFGLARQQTRQAIHNLLDPELDHEYGIANSPYATDTLEALLYDYCLFFSWDSKFYKNFKKLSQAVGSAKKWDEILSTSELFIELNEFYRLEESSCDSSVFKKIQKERDFTLLRYNAARWIVHGKHAIKCDTRANKITIDTAAILNSIAKDSLGLDSITALLGKCTIAREYEKAMFSKGRYFSCDGTQWKGISAPAYYGNIGEVGEVVFYDDQYFMCTDPNYWNVVQDEKLLPPVKAFEKCKNGRIVEMDKKYYRCTYIWSREWSEIPKDSITLYQKNGKFCSDSTEGTTEVVNGEYFTCNYYAWKKLTILERELYKQETAHKDECKNGSKGTMIYWNESAQVYFYCNYKTKKWHYVQFVGRVDYVLNAFDKGIYVDSTTIQATNNEFTFTINQAINRLYGFEIVNSTATIDSHTYGVKFINKTPYISGERGNQTISLKTLTDKSDNFDDFVNQYAHSESAYPVYSMHLTHVGKESYMDYEHAQKFCPKGYHLPDTSEWTEDFLKVFPVDSLVNHDSPLYVRYNMKTYLYDIYWTTASKDSSTQYCYEIRKEDNKGPMSQIIECPKDLYPGVQTLCFKDGDGND